jgi:hypothetical protein
MSAEVVSSWIAQTLAVDLLREVLHRCKREGLPVLAVKGTVTSRFLYADISQRPIGDVDLRIRRSDYWRWYHLAGEWKSRCVNVTWSYRVRTYQFGPLCLDIETDIGPPHLCSLTIDSVLARAQTMLLAPGVECLVPELHDHAVILLVNAFKDRFAVGNPYSIEDLDRVVRFPSFDPSTLMSRIREGAVVTLAWIVASWMEKRQPGGPWRMIRTAIEDTGRPRRHYAAVYARLIDSSLAPTIPGYCLAMAGADRRGDQAWTAATTLAWLTERWIRGRTRMRTLG